MLPLSSSVREQGPSCRAETEAKAPPDEVLKSYFSFGIFSSPELLPQLQGLEWFFFPSEDLAGCKCFTRDAFVT